MHLQNYPFTRIVNRTRTLGRVILICLVTAPGWVAAEHSLTIAEEVPQGALVVGKTVPRAHVRYKGRKVRVSTEGDFVIGIERDAPETVEVHVTFPDGRHEARRIRIEQRKYPTEQINGLPDEMVHLNPADKRNLLRHNRLIARLRKHDTDVPYFKSGFAWPAIGPITSHYGAERTLNGEVNEEHYGVDIAVPVGTPVKAPADGVVAYVAEDVPLAGNMVLIDHGYGLNSSLLHLSEIAVKPGQKVQKGDVIGQAGATGRTTGPHAHWAVNWFDVRLDAALIAPPMPKRK